MGKGYGYHEFHLHALGEFPHLLVVGELKFLQAAAELFTAPVLVEGSELLLYLLCGQMLRKIEAVKDHSYTLLYRYTILHAVKPEDGYLSAFRLRHIEYGAYGRSLAGAVLSDKSHDIPLGK